MKRTALQRRTPLKARQKPLQNITRSITTKPRKPLRKAPMKPGRKVKATADESVRLVTVKRIGCVCCMLNPLLGLKVASHGPCDAHHTLSGGRRRGHAFSLGLCKWHHQAEPPEAGMGEREAIATYGPTVATGSKPFHAMYGSDDELLEFQDALLARVREVAQ